jgi:hypothetical protein
MSDVPEAAMTETVTTKTCTVCGRVLPVTEFNWKSKARGLRHPKCRSCQNAYNRADYSAKAPIRAGQIRGREQRVVAEAAEWLTARYADLTCAHCGSREHLVAIGVREAEGRPLSRLAQEGYSLARIKAAFEQAVAEGRIVCLACSGSLASTRLHQAGDLPREDGPADEGNPLP